jgi:hypothetical protein
MVRDGKFLATACNERPRPDIQRCAGHVGRYGEKRSFPVTLGAFAALPEQDRS